MFFNKPNPLVWRNPSDCQIEQSGVDFHPTRKSSEFLSFQALFGATVFGSCPCVVTFLSGCVSWLNEKAQSLEKYGLLWGRRNQQDTPDCGKDPGTFAARNIRASFHGAFSWSWDFGQVGAVSLQGRHAGARSSLMLTLSTNPS